MQTFTHESLSGRAGRLADAHAMIWVRRLKASVAEAWRAASTRDGLARWWIAPPKTFELRVGGLFDHHWRNTITDFRAPVFIDFAENTAAYAGTGGMRFELARAGEDATEFLFLDTWGPDMTPPNAASGEQPGGPGTPWSGVAAGWHAMMDRLERLFDPSAPAHGYEELQRFYAEHLRDLYRLRAMVQRARAARD